MPGLLGVWTEASVGQKIGLITVSSLAVGGVVYGVYLLKVQKPKPPPRPSTPVRRVDPFEADAMTAPKTPPKTLPKPKLPIAKPEEKKTEDPESLSLTEKDIPKTPPSSPIHDDPAPLSSSTLASFEPISMSQVSSVSASDVPSMPSLHLSPQNIDYGNPSSISTSLGTDDSSLSFVKLSMPDEPKQPVTEQSVKVEESKPAFAAMPPPKADTPPLDMSSEVTTPSTADTSISFVKLSKDDEEEVIREAAERESSIEEELEAIQRRRAKAEDEDQDDGTTMATLGSDTEHTVGGDEDIAPDFESELCAEEEEEDEEEDEGSQSGDSDIQRLDEEEPADAEPPKPELTQAAGDTQGTTQPPSTQASAAGDSKLKEKDENDIVVISTETKAGVQ